MTTQEKGGENAEAVADFAALAAIADLIVGLREGGLQGFSTPPGERTRAVLVMCVGDVEAQRLWPVS